MATETKKITVMVDVKKYKALRQVLLANDLTVTAWIDSKIKAELESA